MGRGSPQLLHFCGEEGLGPNNWSVCKLKEKVQIPIAIVCSCSCTTYSYFNSSLDLMTVGVYNFTDMILYSLVFSQHPYLIKERCWKAWIFSMADCLLHDIEHDIDKYPLYYDMCFYPENQCHVFKNVGTVVVRKQNLGAFWALWICSSCFNGQRVFVHEVSDGFKLSFMNCLLELEKSGVVSATFTFCGLILHLIAE